jgi:uncharacterized protein (UPF0335 family)
MPKNNKNLKIPTTKQINNFVKRVNEFIAPEPLEFNSENIKKVLPQVIRESNQDQRKVVEEYNLRQQISEILVKWGMPTKQVAITELTKLLEEKIRADFSPSFFEKMKHIDQPKKEGWRDRFEEYKNNRKLRVPDDKLQVIDWSWIILENFISQELTSQQQEFIKLVKLLRREEGQLSPEVRDKYLEAVKEGYNDALSDILSAIQGNLKGREDKDDK